MCEVLHQLVGMYDVERGVRETQLVGVPDQQPEIPDALRTSQCLRRGHRRRCGVNTDDPALRQPPGQIERDSPRTDADVQQPVSNVQAWKQIGRGVLSSSPAVRSKHRVVMSMREDLPRRFRHQESVSALRNGDISGSASEGMSMGVLHVDCDTCVARGSACSDCVVTVLLGTSGGVVDLDPDEQAALKALAGSGLVPPLRLIPGTRKVRDVQAQLDWRDYA